MNMVNTENMEKFNIQDFKDLMSKASEVTDSTQKVKPLFENVPNKLRDFASKTMSLRSHRQGQLH